MKLDHYDFIIGIDQVGAVDSKGDPKPLPISILYLDQNSSWKLITKDHLNNPLELKSLNYENLFDLCIELFSIDISFCNIFISVDAVLGLPHKINRDNDNSSNFIRKYIKQSIRQPKWGLTAGKIFFNKILKESGYRENSNLLRESEVSLKANSVFKTTPFQRNIQTGTFRIWKDLASFPLSKIFIFPYDRVDPKKPHIIISEGYPTLAWKVLNNTNRTKQDYSLLKKCLPEIKNINLIKDSLPDQKDAVMLSLFVWKLLKDEKIYLKGKNTEGAILGHHSISEPSQDKN